MLCNTKYRASLKTTRCGSLQSSHEKTTNVIAVWRRETNVIACIDTSELGTSPSHPQPHVCGAARWRAVRGEAEECSKEG